MNTSHFFCFASLASPCRCALWSLLSGLPSPLSPQVWGWCNVRTQGPISSKAEQLFLIGAWTRDTESFCWNIWVPKTHHPETLADQVQTYGHSSNRLSALCSLNLTPHTLLKSNEQIMHVHVHTYPSSGSHIFAQDTQFGLCCCWLHRCVSPYDL